MKTPMETAPLSPVIRMTALPRLPAVICVSAAQAIARGTASPGTVSHSHPVLRSLIINLVQKPIQKDGQ